MAVLDTFYIQFKSQGAKSVKKDEDQLAQSSKRLERNLRDANAQANNLGNSFFDLGKRLAGALAGFVAVNSLVSDFKGAIEYAQNIDKASRSLQVNADELDMWGSAVERIGGTAEGFQSSLKNLSERLYVSGQNALKVLPKLADALQRMNRTQALRYGRMLGLDEYTVQLLRKGRGEVQKAIDHQKELGLVSKHNAVIVREYGMAWHDSSQAFRTAFLEAAGQILPILTKVLTKFANVGEFFAKHANLITGALVGIAGAAIAVAAPFVIANAAIIAITASIGALIGAFALVYDDIKSFLEGNISVTGGLVKAWKDAGASIEGVFMQMWQVIQGVFARIKQLFTGLFDDIGAAVTKVTGVFHKIKNLAPHRMNVGADMSIDDSAAYKTAQKNVNLLTNNSLLAAPPAPYLQSNGAGSQSTAVNTGDITIQTQATDADGIAAAFKQSMVDQFRQTVNTFDDGVSI